LNKATDETAEPILTRNISKRTSPRKVRTSGGQNNNFTISGVKIPQNSPKLARIGISQPNPQSSHISVIDEAIRVKFDRQIENGERYPKSAKLGQKGSYGSHVTHFWNFGMPLISRERLKLETSNLAQRRVAVSTNKKCKIRSKGVMWDHVTHFWNFGSRISISGLKSDVIKSSAHSASAAPANLGYISVLIIIIIIIIIINVFLDSDIRKDVKISASRVFKADIGLFTICMDCQDLLS